MHQVNWAEFKSDTAILGYLASLPRYRNTALKSFYRRFLFFVHLLLCKITRQERPLFVVLATNNDCNLDCYYCYGEYGKRGNKNNYTTRKLLEIIDELKALGCRLLTIHGGESLLRKDIGEILNYCKSSGFYVSFNTNGYLVPKRIEELVCVDTLVFSLDGGQVSNDYNRGEGTFRRVMEGIAAAKKRKLPIVLSATLTAYNRSEDDMDFLAKLALEENLRIQYHLLYNYEKLSKRDGYDGILTDAQTRSLVKKIRALKKAGYPVYYHDTVLDQAISWPASYEEKRAFNKEELPALRGTKPIPCYHGKLKYQIDADGRVVRCWAEDKKDAPNLHTQGLGKALQACHQDDHCRHCAYLSNNEHNAMLDLNPRNVLHVASVQIVDAFKRAWI